MRNKQLHQQLQQQLLLKTIFKLEQLNFKQSQLDEGAIYQSQAYANRRARLQ
jgi:hypothetical protein